MRILIEYDSCWHMSFLGDNDKKPIHKVKKQMNVPNGDGYMQKFVATTETNGQQECNISRSTVLGVLCRLIGDQRKLYQSRNAGDFYFSDIEENIFFEETKLEKVSELVYLTNKSNDRCGQSTWLGVLPDYNDWFDSPIAAQFWSVLFLNRENLLNFILSDKAYLPLESETSCKPTSLLSRLNKIADIKNDDGRPWSSVERLQEQQKKIKSKILAEQEKIAALQDKFDKNPPKNTKQQLTNRNKLETFEGNLMFLNNQLEEIGAFKEWQHSEERLNKTVELIQKSYPDNKYWKDGELSPSMLYVAALYLQANRLLKSGADVAFMLDKNQEVKIKGFSLRRFNGARDWLNSMAGGRKKAVGSPCNIKKQSGCLHIELKLDSESKGLYFKEMSRSQEIKTLIENAGVSSFYLGKKGLAYVSNIRL